MSETYTPGCWFAANVVGCGPCDGRLVRVHLIPKQVIKREAPKAWLIDQRCWVPGCGAWSGLGGHHGQLDQARTLRIPREALPAGLEEFAAEFGLGWYLDREYGPKDGAS